MLCRLLPALGLVAALGACAADEMLQETFSGSGEVYDYAALELELVLPPGPPVAATAIDRREPVIAGDESPRFVGTGPGRYHNTVDVSTASERPLAELVTEAVGAALGGRRSATALPLPEGTSDSDAIAALAASGADRLLLVRINEWQTNTQVRVAAQWHLEATVYDRAGQVLGQRTRQGAATIGTANLQQGAGPVAVAALAQQLELLLNDPAIAGALSPA